MEFGYGKMMQVVNIEGLEPWNMLLCPKEGKIHEYLCHALTLSLISFNKIFCAISVNSKGLNISFCKAQPALRAD